MKILLTGATGYLGSHLAKALLENGHELISLRRSRSNLSRLDSYASEITFYEHSQEVINDIFVVHEDIDLVVHTATAYGRKGESEDEVYKTNVYFPLETLELAIQYGVKSFINLDTILNPQTNVYSLSKNCFKNRAKSLIGKGDMAFLNVRLDHFYGPNDDRSKFPSWLVEQCLSGTKELSLSLGEQCRDFIYIDDLVFGLSLIIKNHERFKAYVDIDLGCGTSIKVSEFVKTVHQLTGSKARLNFGAVPYREFELMKSELDLKIITSLGWTASMDLKDGILRMINAFEN